LTALPRSNNLNLCQSHPADLHLLLMSVSEFASQKCRAYNNVGKLKGLANKKVHPDSFFPKNKDLTLVKLLINI
jgi:hypothetical protein